MADILAEKQTERRGYCPNCRRAEVPINSEGICAPCTLNPGWLDKKSPTLSELVSRFFGATGNAE
jgi:hypothetical protein